MNNVYVPYNYDTLRESAITVIRKGDPYWNEKSLDFYKKFTLIELVEWAIQDIFIFFIPADENHDILRSAISDLRKIGSFRVVYLDKYKS